MLIKDYIEANRKMWNETAAVHAQAVFPDVKEKFVNPEFISLDEIELSILSKLNIQNKDVVQLCCNNGQELISVKRLGAGRCVGFDISEGAITQAKELSRLPNADVEFILSDVYKIKNTFHNQFDLVFITVGALGWLPDIDAFFQLVANLLKPSGSLFIYEMHPILNMYQPLTADSICESYFNRGPFRDECEPDYLDTETIVESEAYWFHHKLSDIISAIMQAGLSIQHFKEYPHDISMIHEKTANSKNPPPMSYTLTAIN